MINLLVGNLMKVGAAITGNVSPGYRPFIDPIHIEDYWIVLLLPLVFIISLTYKTIKIDDLSKLASQTFYLTAQIIVFMVLAASALWLLGALV